MDHTVLSQNELRAKRLKNLDKNQTNISAGRKLLNKDELRAKRLKNLENNQTNIFTEHKLLSKDELRAKRLTNLENNQTNTIPSNYNGIGPQKGKEIDLSKPNLQHELQQIRKEKDSKWRNAKLAQKRVYTVNDIENLRKEEFDMNAAGPKQANELDNIGKEALKYTNEFRAKYGLPPLKWHQALCNIAKVHSKNMADKKVPFGHDGFNDRIRQYPFLSQSAAENVATNHGYSANQVAKISVDGWIDSPGHRKNLLSNHNYCGIGIYQTFDGAYYLTQLFALANI